MRPLQHLVVLLPIITLMLGCAQNDDNREDAFHFQGQDCLHCHNVDLQESSHLALGGTVYKSAPLHPEDNTSKVTCNQPLFVRLFESNGSMIFDAKATNRVGDPGFHGKGNIFSLNRNGAIPEGNYTVQIIDKNGSEIISRISPAHSFSGTYDADIPTDATNRYSCNACHSVSGPNDPLIADENTKCWN